MSVAEELALFSAWRKEPPDLQLRWYQSAARDNAREIHSRCRGALVVHPTGTGKTRTGGAIIWDWVARGERVLVLCPTITLTRQTYEGLRKLGLEVGVEQASNQVRRPLPQVVVACVATMRGKRLQRFTPTTFGLVVVDEAHRSTSPLYLAIFKHFVTAKLLGLTATPDRTDGVALRNVFDEVAHELSMLEAIAEGHLTTLRFRTVVTDFDPRALRTLGGDVTAASTEAEIMRSGLLHEAAAAITQLAPTERTVAFLPTVASSQALVAELEARGVPAAHVDGTTPEAVRNETFARFVAGDIRVICNVGVLIEGWDCPAASVIALLNPTRSRSRITQMIGRGTRPCPGKESTLVLDFCPGRMQRGRLASPADALAGKMLSDGVFDLLAKDGDLAGAITKAQKTFDEIEERRQKEEERARAKAERLLRLKWSAKRREVTYQTLDHDAVSILAGAAPANNERAAVHTVAGPDEAERRRREGLVSPKQAMILKRAGLNPDLPWRLARPAFDAWAANGFRFPDDVLSDPRFQRRSA